MWEVAIGVIAGAISGTGMGGGTILILILTMFMGSKSTYGARC